METADDLRKIQETAVSKRLPAIIERLPSVIAATYFRSESVLSQNEYDLVTANQTSSQMNVQLIKFLTKKDNFWNKLIAFLRSEEHGLRSLAEQLELTLANLCDGFDVPELDQNALPLFEKRLMEIDPGKVDIEPHNNRHPNLSNINSELFHGTYSPNPMDEYRVVIRFSRRFKFVNNQDLVMSVRQAVATSMSFKHDNLFQVYGLLSAPVDNRGIAHNPGIVMRYADAGSLQNHIFEQPSYFDFNTKLEVAFSIVKGLDYLHSKSVGVNHCGLKPSNVLLFHKASKLVVQLADFGYGSARFFRDCCAKYWAPELIVQSDGTPLWYSAKGDVFSFGIIFCELLTETPAECTLGPDNLAIMASIKEAKRPLAVPFSARLCRLLDACWMHDREERYNSAAVLKVIGKIIQRKDSGTSGGGGGNDDDNDDGGDDDANGKDKRDDSSKNGGGSERDYADDKGNDPEGQGTSCGRVLSSENSLVDQDTLSSVSGLAKIESERRKDNFAADKVALKRKFELIEKFHESISERSGPPSMSAIATALEMHKSAICLMADLTARNVNMEEIDVANRCGWLIRSADSIRGQVEHLQNIRNVERLITVPSMTHNATNLLANVLGNEERQIWLLFDCAWTLGDECITSPPEEKLPKYMPEHRIESSNHQLGFEPSEAKGCLVEQQRMTGSLKQQLETEKIRCHMSELTLLETNKALADVNDLAEKKKRIDDLIETIAKREEELTKTLARCDQESVSKAAMEKRLHELEQKLTGALDDVKTEKRLRGKSEYEKRHLADKLEAVKAEMEEAHERERRKLEQENSLLLEHMRFERDVLLTLYGEMEELAEEHVLLQQTVAEHDAAAQEAHDLHTKEADGLHALLEKAERINHTLKLQLDELISTKDTDAKLEFFVAGGWGKDGKPLKTIDVFDVQSTLWWQGKFQLDPPRSSFTAARLKGQIWFFGGWDDKNNILSRVDIFVISTSKWIESNIKMPVKLFGSVAVTFENRILLFGGRKDLYSSPLSDVFSFDPLSTKFSKLSSMHTPRSSFGVAFLGGEFYALGGTSSGSYEKVLNSVEKYDPKVDGWTAVASMTTPRYRHITAVIDGTIFVIGGRNEKDQCLKSGESFSPSSSSTWSTIADMPTPRWGASSFVHKGLIHVVGGQNTIGILCSMDIYNPSSNSWTTSPLEMHTAGVDAAFGFM